MSFLSLPVSAWRRFFLVEVQLSDIAQYATQHFFATPKMVKVSARIKNNTIILPPVYQILRGCQCVISTDNIEPLPAGIVPAVTLRFLPAAGAVSRYSVLTGNKIASPSAWEKYSGAVNVLNVIAASGKAVKMSSR